MLNKVAVVALAGTLSLGLVGCGDGDKAQAKPVKKESLTRTVTVVLTDTVPLNLLFNYDDHQCYTKSAADENVPPVGVTVRDSDGKIVGTEELDGAGGVNGEGTCSWTVRFPNVTDSDFYEVTVSSGDFEQTASGKSGGVGESLEVDVNF